MLTNVVHHLETDGDHPQVVESVPGWTHDITNIGAGEIAAICWVNEIFYRASPDTIVCQV